MGKSKNVKQNISEQHRSGRLVIVGTVKVMLPIFWDINGPKLLSGKEIALDIVIN